MIESRLLKRRYIVATAAILIIAILSRAVYDFVQVENLLKDEIDKTSSQLKYMLADHTSHLEKKYFSIAEHYVRDEKVQELIKNRKREELYESLKSAYNFEIKLDKHLYTMHFFDSDNITILRMHKPEMFNDDLTNVRPMIVYSNRTKQPAAGFEVGRNGTTYRIASPIIDKNGQYLGVLEFGIKPSYFISEIKSFMDIKAQFLVETDSLRILTKNQDRELLGDYSVIESDSIFKKINSDIDFAKEHQILKIDDKTYALFNNIYLENYKGYKSSRLIVAKDITKIVNKYEQSIYIIYGLNFLVLVIVLLMFRKYIDKTLSLQTNLEDLNKTLEDKVKRRTSEQGLLLSLFDKGKPVLFKWKNDDNLSVSYVSKSVSGLLEHNVESFLSNTITYEQCIHEDDLQRVKKEVKDAINAGKDYFEHDIYRIYTKNKQLKWVYDTTLITRDEEGSINGFVGIVTDVSDMKKKDQQLLVQSRLAKIGEMISMIAHQWRQPIAAISASSIDLNMKIDLEEFDLSKEDERVEFINYTKDSLKDIDNLVRGLTTTIDDFRNFYKPGKNKEKARISETVEKSLNIIRASFKSNNIKVIEEYNSIAELSIYVNELMQVVLNILQNAQNNFFDKKTNNPKATIKTFDADNSSFIEISDNGGGISSDIIDQIFEPYFSTRFSKNGTGLGLYMSKIIVEEHHYGTLSVKNTVSGACFIIEIPHAGGKQ